MMRIRVAFVSAAALFSMACSSGNGVEWTLLGPLPKGAFLSPDRLELPVGATMSARATLIKDGDEIFCEPIVRSRDAAILQVLPSERGDTVFTGESVGTTEIVVECSEESITVTAETTSDAAE